MAEKLGLLRWGSRSLVCSAQEPHPCLVSKPGHTLYLGGPFQCAFHSWTEKAVGVASSMLSLFGAVWLTL